MQSNRKEGIPSKRNKDALLHALAEAAALFVSASSLDKQIGLAFALLGRALEVDRVALFEEREGHGPLEISAHHAWISARMRGKAPAVPPRELLARATPEMAAWRAPLRRGLVVTSTADTVTGSVKDIFRIMHVGSAVLVPIFVEGAFWGNLGIDVRGKRRWTAAEIDVLKTFADLLGCALARARSMRRMADTHAVIVGSASILYRMNADAAASLCYVSENVSQYGYSAAALVERPNLYPSLIHPQDLGQVLADLHELRAGLRDDARREIRVRKPDGTYVWFNANVHSVRDSQNRLTGFEGMLVDITVRKEAEMKLGYLNTVLTTVLESSPDGVLVVDAGARVLSFNRRFSELFAVPLDVLRGGDDERVLKIMSSQMKDEDAFLEQTRYLHSYPEARSDDDLELKDGRFVERHAATLLDEKRQYLGRIWFFREITEQRQAERKIDELARTDPLTGLANRGIFLERLNAAFSVARRGSEPFAILYLDIDHFKDVNDTLGHAAGDALLKAVSKRILNAVRESDVVARLGGDEFAILQCDLADILNAGTLAAKVRASVAQPYTIDGSEVHITTSVGIAFYTAETAGSAEMLAYADRALHRAKEKGRDQYRFHSGELDELVRERVDIADELRRAVECNELELYYQPQIAIAASKVIGMEALLRWNHRTRGVLLPNSFIPIAEKAGVTFLLGHWVLDSACRQLRQWRDGGHAVPSIAINLSAAQLKGGRDFVTDVAAILDKWGLAPTDLEFDIGEGVLAEITRGHPDVIERLRKLGVGIAIDDFGTDFTAVGSLNAGGVKRFKIAPQFVQAVARTMTDANIIRAMIGLAHQLGIEVIAEGVETEAQHDFFLSTAENAEAQGYFYSRPLPANEATELLYRYERGGMAQAPAPDLATSGPRSDKAGAA